MDQDLIDWQGALDSYITDRRGPEQPYNPTTFRASSISGCIRQCMRLRLGLKKFSPETYRHFEIGTRIHRLFQGELSLGYLQRPLEFERKVEFIFNNVTFTGHIDCWDPETKTIYDFKSTASIEYAQSFPTNPGYIMQLGVYAHAMKTMRTVLVYVDKRSWRILQKPIEPAPIDYIAKFCDKVIVAEQMYKERQELPDPDGCFMCKEEN